MRRPIPRDRRGRVAGGVATAALVAPASPAALVVLAALAASGGASPARAEGGDLAPIDLGGAEAGARAIEAPPSIDGVEARIRDGEARLRALDEELERSRAERAALEARLDETGDTVAERRARVAGLEADIARFEATLEGLEADVAAERATVERRRALLAASLAAAWDASRRSPLAALLEHEDPAEADRIAVWTGYVMRAQRDAIEAQRDALARIEAARARALKDRNWLEYLKDKASGQRDERLAALARGREALGEVEARIESGTRSVETLRADNARLLALMEELQAAEAARSGYFEAARGALPMPVEGRVDARFGDVKSVGRLTWNGLFVRAEAGAPVRAVADGEIVYGDWLEGFGMLVIVDHGDGWMSLYGGNREVVAAPGQWVESGATIATVGDSGGQNVPGLYFEIRRDAEPVDPAPFLDPAALAGAARPASGGAGGDGSGGA